MGAHKWGLARVRMGAHNRGLMKVNRGASRSESRYVWMRGLAEREWVCTTKSQQDHVLANVNEGGSRSKSRYTQIR